MTNFNYFVLVIFACYVVYILLDERKRKKKRDEKERRRMKKPERTKAQRQEAIVSDVEYLQLLSDMRVLCRLGMSQRQIAKVLGMAQSNVCRIMKKHGIKKQKR